MAPTPLGEIASRLSLEGDEPEPGNRRNPPKRRSSENAHSLPRRLIQAVAFDPEEADRVLASFGRKLDEITGQRDSLGKTLVVPLIVYLEQNGKDAELVKQERRTANTYLAIAVLGFVAFALEKGPTIIAFVTKGVGVPPP